MPHLFLFPTYFQSMKAQWRTCQPCPHNIMGNSPPAIPLIFHNVFQSLHFNTYGSNTISVSLLYISGKTKCLPITFIFPFPHRFLSMSFFPSGFIQHPFYLREYILATHHSMTYFFILYIFLSLSLFSMIIKSAYLFSPL